MVVTKVAAKHGVGAWVRVAVVGGMSENAAGKGGGHNCTVSV